MLENIWEHFGHFRTTRGLEHGAVIVSHDSDMAQRAQQDKIILKGCHFLVLGKASLESRNTKGKIKESV
jgi:hypothetical protein